MDANGNLIPIVDDDQGEGYKDPVTNEEAFNVYTHVFELEAAIKTLEELQTLGKKVLRGEKK